MLATITAGPDHALVASAAPPDDKALRPAAGSPADDPQPVHAPCYDCYEPVELVYVALEWAATSPFMDA